MTYKSPLILALESKARSRRVLKQKFKAGEMTREELNKRCLELTRKHA